MDVVAKRTVHEVAGSTEESRSNKRREIDDTQGGKGAVKIYSAFDVELLRKKLKLRIEDDPYGDCPVPVERFEDIDGLPVGMLASLLRNGITSPMPIQSQALPLMLKGRDVIGVAQTGSGKTLAYLLPAAAYLLRQGTREYRVSRPPAPHVLILAPTRELVVQIAHEAEKVLDTPEARIDSVAVFGGGDRDVQQRAVESGCDIIAATPGRLHDFIASEVLTIKRVGYFVLDEADCMLDSVWGHAEDVASLVEQVKPDRRMFFFGATWNAQVQSVAQGFCQNNARPVRISYAQEEVGKPGEVLSTGKAREGIVQEVLVVDWEGADKWEDQWERWEKQEACKYTIMAEHVTKVLQESEEHKVLVFVGTKRLADKLSNQLREQGFSAGAMHGGKPQSQRLWVLQQFRSGALKLLVCTDVLSRGIDIPDLSHVVIHEMGEIEEYIHRIGRTARGRDAKGHALVFFEYCERNSQCAADFIKVLEDSKQCVPDELRKIAAQVQNGTRRIRAPWKPSDFGYVAPTTPMPVSDHTVVPSRLRAVIILIKTMFTWLRRRLGFLS